MKVLIDSNLIDTAMITDVFYRDKDFQFVIHLVGPRQIIINRSSNPHSVDHNQFKHYKRGWDYISTEGIDRLSEVDKKEYTLYIEEVQEARQKYYVHMQNAVKEMYENLLEYWSPGQTQFPDLTVK